MIPRPIPFTVAVTGASRGIGADIARHLAAHVATAEQPLRLVLAGRDEAALAHVSGSLTSENVEVRTLRADLSALDRVDTVASQLWNAFDDAGLDALVNNAGIAITGPAIDMSSDDFQAVIAMNLTSPALLAAAVGRRMAARSDAAAAGGRTGGRIVNITSVAGSRALAEHYAYCSSKAGLIMATKVLATELGHAGIRVNSVSPTVVLTEMGTRVWGDEAKAAPMLARIATGHFAQPADVAAAVEHLLSPGAEMITGHDLVVDGGFSAV